MDLLPCPFCGDVGLNFSQGSNFRWLAYACVSCGMGSETRMKTTSAESRVEAELDAADQWNTRTFKSPYEKGCQATF